MIAMCWLSEMYILELKNSYLFIHIKDVFCTFSVYK